MYTEQGRPGNGHQRLAYMSINHTFMFMLQAGLPRTAMLSYIASCRDLQDPWNVHSLSCFYWHVSITTNKELELLAISNTRPCRQSINQQACM